MRWTNCLNRWFNRKIEGFRNDFFAGAAGVKYRGPCSRCGGRLEFSKFFEDYYCPSCIRTPAMDEKTKARLEEIDEQLEQLELEYVELVSPTSSELKLFHAALVANSKKFTNAVLQTPTGARLVAGSVQTFREQGGFNEN